MSPDEFWEGDPYLTIAYREAHRLRIKERNQELWLNGNYVFDAVMTALSNVHFDNKPHKFNPYLKEPYRLGPMNEEEKKAEARKQTEDARAALNRFSQIWKQSHREAGT